MHSLKVLRRGSHSVACKLHQVCLSFISVHQMAPPLNKLTFWARWGALSAAHVVFWFFVYPTDPRLPSELVGNGQSPWTIPLGHSPYHARLGLQFGVRFVGLGLG